MSLETPAWFDPTYYATQKIEQMNLTEYQGKKDWDLASYRADLASRNLTPYEDFLRINDLQDLRYTNISPNPLFNVGEYLTALAEFANDSGYSYSGYPQGQWTAQKAMEHMFNDYHVSAWDHFTLAGQYDLVNPSNAFDITAYYQQLTAWRNSYVDPDTGLVGWEGKTNWTIRDVIDDNIWDEISPVEGLYGEAAGSGIHAQNVPASKWVTVDEDWNPWVSPDEPDEPSKPQPKPPYWPDYSGGTDTPDTPDDPAWQPDKTVEVSAEKGEFKGADGEDTLFDAKDGLNADSVITGGTDSENVLKVNLAQDFAGFNGSGEDGKAPNLTNVQTVNIINAADGDELSFSGRNTAGVENWNIENGPVDLTDLPDTGVSIGLKDINQANAKVNIGFADDAKGDGSLTFNVNNVGQLGDSETDDSPLAVNVDGANIENLTFVAKKPYNGQGSLARDVIVDATPVGVNFTTDASKAAQINIQEGVSLSGEFYLGKAETVTVDGAGQAGSQDPWRSLVVDAPEATEVKGTFHGDANVALRPFNGHAHAISDGENNHIECISKTATIDDGAGSAGQLLVAVLEQGVINGGGGADNFSVFAAYPTQSENGKQADRIEVTVNGAAAEASESTYICMEALETNMAVTINGYDKTDKAITLGTANGSRNAEFATVAAEAVPEYIEKFFGVDVTDDFQAVTIKDGDDDIICGYYDASTKTAYGFADKGDGGEVDLGVRVNNIANIELAAQAFGYRVPQPKYVQLKEDLQTYKSVDGAAWTQFDAVVGPDDKSTLVPGVQINGRRGDYLSVSLADNFNGLGKDGYVRGVDNLNLLNNTAEALTFNAENMNDIKTLHLSGGQLTVTDLANPLELLTIFKVKQQDATMTVNLSDTALNQQSSNLSLSLGECGTKDSAVKLVMNGADNITNLDIGNGTTSSIDSPHEALFNWLDISAMQNVKDIFVYGQGGELTLFADTMVSTEPVTVSVAQNVVLLGDLNFTNTNSLNLCGSNGGSLGSADSALLLTAGKAEIVHINADSATNLELTAENAAIRFEGMNTLPEYMKLKVDAAASFSSAGTIRGEAVDLDLSGVSGKIANSSSDIDTMFIYARDDAKFTAGNGGSNVSVDAMNMELAGGKGDDTFFALARENAKVEGNGGNDAFFAYAHNDSEEAKEIIKVEFTGTKKDESADSSGNGNDETGAGDTNAEAHDRFIINTYNANTKIALTINGYDKGDSIEIHDMEMASAENPDVETKYLDFADPGSKDALSLIKEFGFEAPDKLANDLIAVTNDDGICGYYSESAKAAFGFALAGTIPTDYSMEGVSATIPTDAIAAVIQVTGIESVDLAKDVFSYDPTSDIGTAMV